MLAFSLLDHILLASGSQTLGYILTIEELVKNTENVLTLGGSDSASERTGICIFNRNTMQSLFRWPLDHCL